MRIPGLTQRALTCLPVVTDSVEYLAEKARLLARIYRFNRVDHAPVYEYAQKGRRNTTTHVEYARQLTALIDAFKSLPGIPEIAFGNFSGFQRTILTHFGDQMNAAFFSEVKKSLEDIYVRVQTLPVTQRNALIEGLADQLIRCQPGLFTTVQVLLSGLTDSGSSPEALIARKRQAVLDDFSGRFIRKKHIVTDWQSHVYLRADEWALANGIVPKKAPAVDPYTSILERYSAILSLEEHVRTELTLRSVTEWVARQYADLFAPFQGRALQGESLDNFNALIAIFTDAGVMTQEDIPVTEGQETRVNDRGEEEIFTTYTVSPWFFHYLPYLTHQLLIKKGYVENTPAYQSVFSYAMPGATVPVRAPTARTLLECANERLPDTLKASLMTLRHSLHIGYAHDFLTLTHSPIVNLEHIGHRRVSCDELQGPFGKPWAAFRDQTTQCVFSPLANAWVHINAVTAYDKLTKDDENTLNYALNLRRLSQYMTDPAYVAQLPAAWQTLEGIQTLAYLPPVLLLPEYVERVVGSRMPEVFSVTDINTLTAYLATSPEDDADFALTWMAFSQREAIPLSRLTQLPVQVQESAWLVAHSGIVREQTQFHALTGLLKMGLTRDEAATFIERHAADPDLARCVNRLGELMPTAADSAILFCRNFVKTLLLQAGSVAQLQQVADICLPLIKLPRLDKEEVENIRDIRGLFTQITRVGMDAFITAMTEKLRKSTDRRELYTAIVNPAPWARELLAQGIPVARYYDLPQADRNEHRALRVSWLQDRTRLKRIVRVFGSLQHAEVALEEQSMKTRWQRFCNTVHCWFSKSAREQRALLTELAHLPAGRVIAPESDDDGSSVTTNRSNDDNRTTLVIIPQSAPEPEPVPAPEQVPESVVLPAVSIEHAPEAERLSPPAVVVTVQTEAALAALGTAIDAFNFPVDGHKHTALQGMVRNSQSTHFFRPKHKRLGVLRDYEVALVQQITACITRLEEMRDTEANLSSGLREKLQVLCGELQPYVSHTRCGEHIVRLHALRDTFTVVSIPRLT